MNQSNLTARTSSEVETLRGQLAAALEQNEQLKSVIAAQARELEALLDEHSRPTEPMLSAAQIAVWEAQQ